MPRLAVGNTSPLQYLYQVDQIHLLPRFYTEVMIPPAVERELAVGRSLGVNLIQRYSRTNDIQVLIETVRALYQHQGAGSSQEFSTDKPVSKIRREDLKLICYEYIDA